MVTVAPSVTVIAVPTAAAGLAKLSMTRGAVVMAAPAAASPISARRRSMDSIGSSLARPVMCSSPPDPILMPYRGDYNAQGGCAGKESPGVHSWWRASRSLRR